RSALRSRQLLGSMRKSTQDGMPPEVRDRATGRIHSGPLSDTRMRDACSLPSARWEACRKTTARAATPGTRGVLTVTARLLSSLAASLFATLALVAPAGAATPGP